MNDPESECAGLALPPEYRVAPLHPVMADVPLRLAVVVRVEPDPVAGHFVLLHDLLGARVYLGAICDAAGRVRSWVEIRVQNVEGVETTPGSPREVLSNRLLDQQWAAECEACRSWAPGSFVTTGWEARHPLPTLIDLTAFAAVYPVASPEGECWVLCQEDDVLAAAGLAPYSTSLARYLYQPGAGRGSRFVPVVSGAPEDAVTVPKEQALGLNDRRVPFNIQGGLLMVSDFHPLGVEAYLDVLSGKPWEGLVHGRKRLDLGDPYRSLTHPDQRKKGVGFLTLEAQGRFGQVVETLHLKLQLLADAFRAVRAAVRAHQRPFLNLSPESFQVKLSPASRTLPFHWTAQLAVARPSQARLVQAKNAPAQLFVRVGADNSSIYSPSVRTTRSHGSGPVRLRRALLEQGDRIVVEGTLTLPEPPQCASCDVLWLRLPLAQEALDLYARMESDSLAFAEVRFRTLPHQVSEAVRSTLLSGAAAMFPRCQYEIIPLISSPHDLYSLAVLAVRALLVSENSALPLVLDEILSLARQLAVEHQPEPPLPARIAALFGQKAEWLASLGPHRLTTEPLTPEEAAALVPAELWQEILAFIVRLFPGAGPDSHCSNLGDAPPSAIDAVFEHPLAELEALLVKTRSLLVIDWNRNREIRAAIEEVAGRIASAALPKAG